MLETWLRRLLFFATLGGAACLALFVLVVAPLLVYWGVSDAPLVQLFADETTVRRTSLGAAVGLALTAYFCFRRKPKPTEPPPPA